MGRPPFCANSGYLYAQNMKGLDSKDQKQRDGIHGGALHTDHNPSCGRAS